MRDTIKSSTPFYSEMENEASEIPKVEDGDHIILQRENYKKLLKINRKKAVQLGSDQILLGGVVGQPYETAFKLCPTAEGKKMFTVDVTNILQECYDGIRKESLSGQDNRNILDDGHSQKLSKEEIEGLREKGMSGQEIVGQLIENSTTFKEKTEYSQQKYLQKKQKKYLEYVIVRKPTIRLLSQVLYTGDPLKIMNLRMDTLSQMLTMCNVQSGGRFVLYEAGCQGLLVAAVLERLAGQGNLIHIHSGNFPQRQSVHAMKFPQEQMRCLSSLNVNVFFKSPRDQNTKKTSGIDTETNLDLTLLEETSVEVIVTHSEPAASKCGNTVSSNETEVAQNKRKSEDSAEHGTSKKLKILDEEGESSSSEMLKMYLEKNDSHVQDVSVISTEESLQELGEGVQGMKNINLDNGCLVRSNEMENENPARSCSDKKTGIRKTLHEQNEVSLKILQQRPVDGLLIASRQHPANLLLLLSQFLAPSRPFVVFSPYKEPLIDAFMAMKEVGGAVNLKISETWLRNYQVLADRTHPEIIMSGGGGYLLTGIVVTQHAGQLKENEKDGQRRRQHRKDKRRFSRKK